MIYRDTSGAMIPVYRSFPLVPDLFAGDGMTAHSADEFDDTFQGSVLPSIAWLHVVSLL